VQPMAPISTVSQIHRSSLVWSRKLLRLRLLRRFSAWLTMHFSKAARNFPSSGSGSVQPASITDRTTAEPLHFISPPRMRGRMGQGFAGSRSHLRRLPFRGSQAPAAGVTRITFRVSITLVHPSTLVVLASAPDGSSGAVPAWSRPTPYSVSSGLGRANSKHSPCTSQTAQMALAWLASRLCPWPPKNNGSDSSTSSSEQAANGACESYAPSVLCSVGLAGDEFVIGVDCASVVAFSSIHGVVMIRTGGSIHAVKNVISP
jgi:hypothetical protein